ncbi:hypothetical protein FNS94_24000 [Salmonella enterica]|nr:hypothetical protein [Salmonella enterica]
MLIIKKNQQKVDFAWGVGNSDVRAAIYRDKKAGADLNIFPDSDRRETYFKYIPDTISNIFKIRTLIFSPASIDYHSPA